MLDLVGRTSPQLTRLAMGYQVLLAWHLYCTNLMMPGSRWQFDLDLNHALPSAAFEYRTPLCSAVSVLSRARTVTYFVLYLCAVQVIVMGRGDTRTTKGKRMR